MDKLLEIGTRIKDLRDVLDISVYEMAKHMGMSQDEYKEHENGNRDFSCSFLYKCASKLNVDIVVLLTGETAKLNSFVITRKGKGVSVKSGEHDNFDYKYLASTFKKKAVEPFLVTAPFLQNEQDIPISKFYKKHAGQEMDFVLSGTLKMDIEGNTFLLEKGDSVFFDSTKEHAIIATGGKDAVFLAIVIKDKENK